MKTYLMYVSLAVVCHVVQASGTQASTGQSDLAGCSDLLTLDLMSSDLPIINMSKRNILILISWAHFLTN